MDSITNNNQSTRRDVHFSKISIDSSLKSFYTDCAYSLKKKLYRKVYDEICNKEESYKNSPYYNLIFKLKMKSIFKIIEKQFKNSLTNLDFLRGSLEKNLSNKSVESCNKWFDVAETAIKEFTEFISNQESREYEKYIKNSLNKYKTIKTKISNKTKSLESRFKRRENTNANMLSFNLQPIVCSNNSLNNLPNTETNNGNVKRSRKPSYNYSNDIDKEKTSKRSSAVSEFGKAIKTSVDFTHSSDMMFNPVLFSNLITNRKFTYKNSILDESNFNIHEFNNVRESYNDLKINTNYNSTMPNNAISSILRTKVKRQNSDNFLGRIAQNRISSASINYKDQDKEQTQAEKNVITRPHQSTFQHFNTEDILFSQDNNYSAYIKEKRGAIKYKPLNSISEEEPTNARKLSKAETSINLTLNIFSKEINKTPTTHSKNDSENKNLYFDLMQTFKSIDKYGNFDALVLVTLDLLYFRILFTIYTKDFYNCLIYISIAEEMCSQIMISNNISDSLNIIQKLFILISKFYIAEKSYNTAFEILDKCLILATEELYYFYSSNSYNNNNNNYFGEQSNNIINNLNSNEEKNSFIKAVSVDSNEIEINETASETKKFLKEKLKLFIYNNSIFNIPLNGPIGHYEKKTYLNIVSALFLKAVCNENQFYFQEAFFYYNQSKFFMEKYLLNSIELEKFYENETNNDLLGNNYNIDDILKKKENVVDAFFKLSSNSTKSIFLLPFYQSLCNIQETLINTRDVKKNIKIDTETGRFVKTQLKLKTKFKSKPLNSAVSNLTNSKLKFNNSTIKSSNGTPKSINLLNFKKTKFKDNNYSLGLMNKFDSLLDRYSSKPKLSKMFNNSVIKNNNETSNNITKKEDLDNSYIIKQDNADPQIKISLKKILDKTDKVEQIKFYYGLMDSKKNKKYYYIYYDKLINFLLKSSNKDLIKNHGNSLRLMKIKESIFQEIQTRATIELKREFFFLQSNKRRKVAKKDKLRHFQLKLTMAITKALKSEDNQTNKPINKKKIKQKDVFFDKLSKIIGVKDFKEKAKKSQTGDIKVDKNVLFKSKKYLVQVINSEKKLNSNKSMKNIKFINHFDKEVSDDESNLKSNKKLKLLKKKSIFDRILDEKNKIDSLKPKRSLSSGHLDKLNSRNLNNDSKDALVQRKTSNSYTNLLKSSKDNEFEIKEDNESKISSSNLSNHHSSNSSNCNSSRSQSKSHSKNSNSDSRKSKSSSSNNSYESIFGVFRKTKNKLNKSFRNKGKITSKIKNNNVSENSKTETIKNTLKKNSNNTFISLKKHLNHTNSINNEQSKSNNLSNNLNNNKSISNLSINKSSFCNSNMNNVSSKIKNVSKPDSINDKDKRVKEIINKFRLNKNRNEKNAYNKLNALNSNNFSSENKASQVSQSTNNTQNNSEKADLNTQLEIKDMKIKEEKAKFSTSIFKDHLKSKFMMSLNNLKAATANSNKLHNSNYKFSVIKQDAIKQNNKSQSVYLNKDIRNDKIIPSVSATLSPNNENFNSINCNNISNNNNSNSSLFEFKKATKKIKFSNDFDTKNNSLLKTKNSLINNKLNSMIKKNHSISQINYHSNQNTMTSPNHKNNSLVDINKQTNISGFSLSPENRLLIRNDNSINYNIMTQESGKNDFYNERKSSHMSNYSLYSKNTKNMSFNSTFKYKTSTLEVPVKKHKKQNKFLLSSSYRDSYMNIEKLHQKELTFQKQLLSLRKEESISYFDKKPLLTEDLKGEFSNIITLKSNTLNQMLIDIQQERKLEIENYSKLKKNKFSKQLQNKILVNKEKDKSLNLFINNISNPIATANDTISNTITSNTDLKTIKFKNRNEIINNLNTMKFCDTRIKLINSNIEYLKSISTKDGVNKIKRKLKNRFTVEK